MNFTYSGATIIHETFTQVTGTRQELVDWISAKLQAAGWTPIGVATPGTAVVTLRSAATPHGLRMRVQISATTGSSWSVAFCPISDDGIYTGGWTWVLPGVGLIWRIIASPWYVRLFRDAPAAGRDTFYCESLYIPAPLRPATTECFMTGGNCASDSENSGTNYSSLRTGLHCNNTHTAYSVGYNGQRWKGSGFVASGHQQAIVRAGAIAGCKQFPDGSYVITDVPIGWGLTSQNDAPLQMGIMWDAAWTSDPLTYGSVRNFDDHNWFCWTNQDAAGSILLVVP
jgi:hypothetical protein